MGWPFLCMGGGAAMLHVLRGSAVRWLWCFSGYQQEKCLCVCVCVCVCVSEIIVNRTTYCGSRAGLWLSVKVILHPESNFRYQRLAVTELLFHINCSLLLQHTVHRLLLSSAARPHQNRQSRLWTQLIITTHYIPLVSSDLLWLQ